MWSSSRSKVPKAALQVGTEIIAVAESLAFFPQRGVPVRERNGIRKVLRWKYAIYYRVKIAERHVEVLRIWDGRQAPWKLRLP